MSKTSNSTKTSQKQHDFRCKFKTERCRYWNKYGCCPFQELCAFAHYDYELRQKRQLNQFYKTKICTNFSTSGYCKYGDRCQFVHPGENQFTETISARLSSSSEQLTEISVIEDNHRHQKNLKILKEFGLDIFHAQQIDSHSKKKRSDFWQTFLNQCEDASQHNVQEPVRSSESTREVSSFQREFPQYDFKRKPRLGSL